MNPSRHPLRPCSPRPELLLGPLNGRAVERSGLGGLLTSAIALGAALPVASGAALWTASWAADITVQNTDTDSTTEGSLPWALGQAGSGDAFPLASGLGRS